MNNRLTAGFNGGKALIPFLTAGDPTLAVTEELIPRLAGAGADVIALGVPFSDPVAGGIVIQKADERALQAGFTTKKLFTSLKKVREKTDIPLVLVTYMNPVFAYGTQHFLTAAAEAGVDGLIVPDVPFDEKHELDAHCRAAGVKLISMIVPGPEERVRAIAGDAEGFLYCLPAPDMAHDPRLAHEGLSALMEQMRQTSDLPCVVSSHADNIEAGLPGLAGSDGVLIETALVRLAEAYSEHYIPHAEACVKAMKAALSQ